MRAPAEAQVASVHALLGCRHTHPPFDLHADLYNTAATALHRSTENLSQPAMADPSGSRCTQLAHPDLVNFGVSM